MIPKCEHCNTNHGIFENWAKCGEKRAFDENLDRWAEDMAQSFDQAYHDQWIRARLNTYVRIVR